MNVVSKRGLLKLTAKCPEAEIQALDWYRISNAADWSCFADVRRTFPRADLIGEVLVFDLFAQPLPADYHRVLRRAGDLHQGAADPQTV